MDRFCYARSAALTMVLALGCDKGGETATPADVAAEPDEMGDPSGDLDESTEESRGRGSIDQGEDEVLTVSGFEAAVNEHLQDVVDCFSDAKAKNKKLGAKLVADFKIDGKGNVTAVHAQDGADDAGLLTCIKDKAQNWALPPPPGGEPTNFTFPFDFTPA